MRTSMALRAVGCIVLSGGLLFAHIEAAADDLFPPPWRGQPRSTFAEWAFATAANPTPPDGPTSPVVGDSGGVPMAEMESDLMWDPVFGGSWGPTGIGIPINTLIYLDIPNWIDQEPVKFLQIQITYQPGMGSPYVFDVLGSDPADVSDPLNVSELEIDPLNGIWHRTELWRIRPNPDFETIVIDVPRDSRVAQIVVDTISLPEPCSAALMLLGLLSFGPRSKRR